TGGGGPSNVFSNLIKNALRGEEAIVPAATIGWVYSKDAAAGTVLALRAKSLPSRVFNVTMGRLTSPEELMSAVKAAVPGAKLRVDKPADATPALQTMSRASSAKRAQAILGYVPRYQMPDAVRDLVDWLEKVKP